MLMQWLSIYNRNKKRRVRLPTFSDNPLVFRSVKRVGSTVIDEISKKKIKNLDPATEIIDLEKYIDKIEPDKLGGIPCDSITLKVVGGEEKYYIIDTFEQFKAINTDSTTRDSNSRYIMRQNIDCSEAKTENRTIATDEDLDDILEWTEGEYDNGQLVKVKNDNGVYPIDNPEATIRYDIYRKTPKTPYTTDYEPSDGPVKNPGYIEDSEDSETYDGIVGEFSHKKYAEDVKYWHIYNYQGFWIDEFSGKFNGNGFELQNCYVNKASGHTGVFSYLDDGKLSNIGVTGSVIGYNTNAGGLIGYNHTSSITNSYFMGSVIGYRGYVGGLIGGNSSSSLVTNSYSIGSVIGYSNFVGGLIGPNSSSSITNSYSTGSVIGYAGYIGGLIGYNSSSPITNSYSTGSVIGYGDYVGGLVGRNQSSSIITNSYSTDSVIGYGDYVGGLVGYNSSSSITNSYYDLTTSGQSDNIGKGEPRTTAEMKDIDNYLPEWDFVNIWRINPTINNGYPYLRVFETTENNAELVFDPATEIIDLEKYIDKIEPDTLGSIACDSITFNTVRGEEKYYIIDTFEQFKAIDTNTTTRGSNSRYIMRQNIDCSKAQTENRTIATDIGVDDIPVWSEETEYTNGDMVKVKNDNGVYPIDNPEATTRYDIYRKTLYTTGYEPSDEPITNPGYTEDSEDYDDIVDGFSQQKYADDLKYWHIYNYKGFWINSFSGKFNGNGFELQNCYVNKTSAYAGVFSQLDGGSIANLGVSGSVIGYGVVVGGLVAHKSASSIITNSYFTGSVIGYRERVGGLVGRNFASSITNSYFTGSVIGYGAQVGGLVGINHTSPSIITNSYSTGSVIGYSSNVGGLVGLNYLSAIVTNSYYDSTTSGLSDDTGRGEPRTTTQMKDINNYLPEWDFNNIWGIDPAINDGYPYLRALESGYTNWLSNYKIVGIPPSSIDGYIKLPTGVTIEGVSYDIFNKMSPIYNEDDGIIPNPTGSTYYLGDSETTVYADEVNYLWHIDELNTATITSYLKDSYKFSWFVKNTFETGTYDPKSVKEIFAYSAPITDENDKTRIKSYIRYDWEA